MTILRLINLPIIIVKIGVGQDGSKDRTFCPPALGRLRCRRAVWFVGTAPAKATDTAPTIDREIECLALTIYFEARGESSAG